VAGLSTAKEYVITSPDRNIELTLALSEGKPYYNLSVNGKVVIWHARLGLKTDRAFKEGFHVLETSSRVVNESYEMLWWNNKEVENHCHEMTLSLQEETENPRRLDIVFRAYNDGVAFRYVSPEQEHLKEFIIEEDLSEFAFSDDHTWWSANGERDNLGPLSINAAKDAVFTPMVLHCAEDLYLAIHEAAIYHYANYKIKRARKPNTFQCDLQGASKAKTGIPTSWRTILIGEKPGDLLESNLLTHLNPPCKIEDTSWIKPGKSMWDWRAWGYTAPDGFTYGLNTPSHKRFIDFAAGNNIDYLLMDADWYGPEFSEDSDPTSANNEIDIEENLAYAREKGVGIVLYLNDVGAKRYGLERVLKQFHDWGVSGVKYGFMSGVGQQKVEHTRRVIELCAKYKLMVLFHDNPIPPSGDVRTWPNVMSREYGHSQADSKYSYYPETAVSAAFINLLTGPLDMCNGWYGFEGSQVRPKVFRFIPGTVAAENAKLVVFTAGLTVMPDAPEEYLRKADLFEFIKHLPGQFEELKVLGGDMESFISLARRSGDSWYIGSLTTREPRYLHLKLDFLEPGRSYTAYLYEDSPETHFVHKREVYQLREKEVHAGSELEVWLAPGGGNAIRIVPKGL
jgi:alpha-glucosidase